ncbi:MAG: phenylacetate--CoA ligase family protein [Deltaproteobacteria bacterium]|nr:phenylacetate--CoA ligase family protein [Deltaproteobacteria bacterium]
MEESLKRSLRLVASRSKFYRERFFIHKIDINRIQSPADLGALFTTADDLLNTPSEEFLCAPPQLAFETAGTSGRNKRLFYRYEEFDMAARRGAMGFYLFGLQKEDRILNAFDFSFWFPGYFMSRLLPFTGMFSITVGKIEPIEIYRRMEDYRFTVILGEPTWVVQLTELAQEKAKAYPLKLIIGSGEMLTERAREWVEKTWSAEFLMAYASVDAGTYIGIECYKKQGYHINDAELWVEIVDPNKDGYGEVVFTTLLRTTMPLIRYRTKDVARLIKEPCPCGRPGPRLSKIVGRSDEIVVFGGGNIHPSFFEEIFKEIPEISEDWQVAVRHRGVKEVLEFRLELKENGLPTEPVSDRIRKAIETVYPDMWRNYAKGMYDMEFVYYAKHTLREKRKLRRLIDEREEIVANLRGQ